MLLRYEYFDRVTDDFVALTRRLDEELTDRNGPWQAEYNVYNALDGIHDVVLAYVGSEPVGCAAMKPLESGAYEVKRVFVAPEHRRHGVAKALMDKLEAVARTQGIGEFVLETADTLASALALYQTLGYRVIANYGQYRGKPHSVCFGKSLDAIMLTVRKVDASELELLVKLRMDFCAEDAPEATREELAALEGASRAWLREHLEAGTYWGYVGFLGEEPVCCAGLLLYTLPPVVRQLDRCQGHVLNFYTYAQHRRRGYGTKLMDRITADAKIEGLDRLVLNSTKLGEPLYLKSGVHDPAGRSLVLKLR